MQGGCSGYKTGMSSMGMKCHSSGCHCVQMKLQCRSKPCRTGAKAQVKLTGPRSLNIVFACRTSERVSGHASARPRSFHSWTRPGCSHHKKEQQQQQPPPPWPFLPRSSPTKEILARLHLWPKVGQVGQVRAAGILCAEKAWLEVGFGIVRSRGRCQNL